MSEKNIRYYKTFERRLRRTRSALCIATLACLSFLCACIESEDEDAALLLIAGLAATNSATPSQAACNQVLRTINGTAAGQFMSFTTNPTTTAANNAQISFATSSMTLTDVFTLASISADMTAADVQLYSGSDCAAVNTPAVTTRLTGCGGDTNTASCSVTVAGDYVFQITYSASITDMAVSIGTP